MSASLVQFFFDKDSGVILQWTVQNQDTTVVDLTSYTVTLLADGVTGSPFSCTITDAVNGVVQRTTTATDFATGVYKAQLKCVNGGTTLHSEYFILNISQAIS